MTFAQYLREHGSDGMTEPLFREDFGLGDPLVGQTEAEACSRGKEEVD